MLGPVVSTTHDMLVRFRQMLHSILDLCKAIVITLMNKTALEELHRELCAGADDEADHDVRLEEEIPEPAVAA